MTARINYRERYDQLKELVRKEGTDVLTDMWKRGELHLPMGSQSGGGENALHHYVHYPWPKQHSKAPPDSDLAKDQACFLLDAFCAYREKHRWQISRDEGYRIAERASKAWTAKQHARGAIQEASP